MRREILCWICSTQSKRTNSVTAGVGNPKIKKKAVACFFHSIYADNSSTLMRLHVKTLASNENQQIDNFARTFSNHCITMDSLIYLIWLWAEILIYRVCKLAELSDLHDQRSLSFSAWIVVSVLSSCDAHRRPFPSNFESIELACIWSECVVLQIS